MFVPLPTDATRPVRPPRTVPASVAARRARGDVDDPRRVVLPRRLVALAAALRHVAPVRAATPQDVGTAVASPGASDGRARTPRPPAALVASPRTAQETLDVVRLAREHGVPVAVRGAAAGAVGAPEDDEGADADASTRERPVLDGALLVAVDALDHVSVMPVLGRAHVGGGARWDDLVTAAAGYGLAPVDHDACPARLGALAGSARSVDVVTPDGVLRRVPGGIVPAGVVVGLELELVERPVAAP